MELKFKVGDVVKFILLEKEKVGQIKSINFINDIDDAIFMYETGLINKKEVFKNIKVSVQDFNNVVRNISMDKILYKIEENEMAEVKVKITSPLAKATIDNSNINLNIKDYKILNDRAVMFFFEDGTSETTVCAEEDTFNIEEAANIAICKKKFGGSGAYNNAVRRAIKQVYAIDKKKLQEEKERMELEERKARRVERKLKRKAAKRQEQIDIQAEAFFKAMMMYDEQVDLKFKEDQNDKIEIKEIEVVEDKVVEEIETIDPILL